jgi:hypothetical protein
MPTGTSGISPPIWALFLPVVGKSYNRSGGNATTCSAEVPQCGRKEASEAISSRNRAKRRGGMSIMTRRPRFYRGRGVIISKKSSVEIPSKSARGSSPGAAEYPTYS